MNHIRYMSDNKSVCDKPSRLGYDFVVLNTSNVDEPSCDVCSDLIFAYNLLEYRREGRERVATATELNLESSEPIMQTIGFFVGVGISSVVWFVTLIMVLYGSGAIGR